MKTVKLLTCCVDGHGTPIHFLSRQIAGRGRLATFCGEPCPTDGLGKIRVLRRDIFKHDVSCPACRERWADIRLHFLTEEEGAFFYGE